MRTVSSSAPPNPFAVNNVRMFIAFRIFFNCRFYYPIFTVLFLDFGLTIAQFSILNAVWAATIVLAEVPSGALADLLGRRRLVIFAAVAMVVEMAILCLVPRGQIQVLFGFLLVNRVLSGLAEAAASGADEALAYDALQTEGLASQWGRVLEVQMRLKSTGFILTMTTGAAVYDPELLTRVLGWLGYSVQLSQYDTLRYPLYLTFGFALLTLLAAWRMQEVCSSSPASPACDSDIRHSTVAAFRITAEAGRWIVRTPFVLAVICFGMLFDGILRMVVTLASQYYRLIQLPESVFGLLGSAMALLGLFIPRLALHLAQKRSPLFCLWSTALTALVGLSGMALFPPWLGVIPALTAFSALYMVGFYASYYINQHTASERRATVLSFKGLAYNLSYGLIGLVYAGVLEVQKAGLEVTATDSQMLENQIFKETFIGFPFSLAMGLVLLLALALVFKRRSRNRRGSLSL